MSAAVCRHPDCVTDRRAEGGFLWPLLFWTDEDATADEYLLMHVESRHPDLVGQLSLSG